MATFEQLGIPFPLFEAPIEETSCYVGKTLCKVCEKGNQHCFNLDFVMISCPNCKEVNGLDARDRKNTPCRSCDNEIKFLTPFSADGIQVCYSCLREGKGAITKDTEFGMVSWEQAVQGRTHGIPGLQTTDFETIVTDPDDDWIGVLLPQEHLFELLRTPVFTTWQGERWLFCCQKPMTYMGEWMSFASSFSNAKAKMMFDQLLPKETEDLDLIWESVSSMKGYVCLYVFQCKECGKHRANWDMS